MSIERTNGDVTIHPVGPVYGTVRPPGSKSLTNRYLICATLADGHSVFRGASLSDDTLAMMAGLGRLGIPVETVPHAAQVLVTGCRGALPEDEADLNVGHAGTTMRFLTALTCLGYGSYRIDGSPRMRARPIGDLVDALRRLGARIGYENDEGYPPLQIEARGLVGGEVIFRSPPSSQYLSALLMVAPYAKRDVMIQVDGELTSKPYVEMTIDVMRSMHVELVESELQRFVVPAFQRYQGGEFQVEPDASAATYFWTAAAITGGRVRVEGLTRASRQGDARFVDVLAAMGCTVREEDGGLEVSGPPAGELRGVDVDLNTMPDTAQTLAVAALFARGSTNIRNVPNLRIKETDRIAALAAELRKLGAQVTPRDDGLQIVPPKELTPAEIDTYDDHRMAMSFALAGLVVDGVTIRDAGVVSKSVPNYFELLDHLTGGGR